VHIFESNYSTDELINRWDEFTSPARFAGNDDTMDLIFVSKRKGNRVKLVRRARTKRDPFACVFYGKIEESENGSRIRGLFAKSIADYFAVALIIAFFAYLSYYVASNGDSSVTINSLLGASVVIGILLLHNTRSVKRKYAEFISRITDIENDKFFSKKELRELNG
jgi:hypothetical protein